MYKYININSFENRPGPIYIHIFWAQEIFDKIQKTETGPYWANNWKKVLHRLIVQEESIAQTNLSGRKYCTD